MTTDGIERRGLGVVVAAWNRLELTRMCLASLERDGTAEHVVLVDDGSEDDTASRVGQEFPWVEVVRHWRNRGVTAAWNTGLGRLSTELVCILNNDLVVEEGCLGRLVSALDEPWVGVASPETPMDDDEVVPDFMEASRLPESRAESPSPGGAWRVGFAGWCFAFRRRDFPEGFDPRFRLWYQDKDFLYVQLFRRRGVPPFRWPVPGKVPVVVPGARVRHEYHGSHGSLDPEWVSRRTEQEKRRFNRKWRGPQGNRWARDIDWGREVFTDPSVARRLDGSGEIPAAGGVSVVIPCYVAGDPRKREILRATLRSVTEQDHRPLEVVLVDDASAPIGGSSPVSEAAEELRDFDGAWSLWRLERNAGPGIARRRGLEAARGEFVRFLDADDLLAPGAVSRQVAVLRSRPELAMTYALTHSFSDEGGAGGDGTVGRSFPAPARTRVLGRTDQALDRILPELFGRMAWTTSSCLWRRDAVDPEDWRPLFAAEDLLFDFLVGLRDRPVARTPGDETLVLKRQHSASISASIHDDVAYQQEILKAYDLMADADRRTGGRWRRELARLYDRKVMTFLVHRRPWEALHCIRRARELAPRELSLDARVAGALSRAIGSRVPLVLLRKFRWARRLMARRLGRSRP